MKLNFARVKKSLTEDIRTSSTALFGFINSFDCLPIKVISQVGAPCRRMNRVCYGPDGPLFKSLSLISKTE